MNVKLKSKLYLIAAMMLPWLGTAVHSEAITAKILGACTPTTAASAGGYANFSTYFRNSMAVANAIAKRCRTEQYFATSTIQILENPGPTPGAALVNDLASGAYWTGLRNYAWVNRFDCVVLCSPLSDNAGNAFQPGQWAVVDDNQLWWGVIAHEVGHNCNAGHDEGACIPGYRTIMKHNYCAGGTIEYFSFNGTYAGQSILAGNNARRVYDRRSVFSNFR